MEQSREREEGTGGTRARQPPSSSCPSEREEQMRRVKSYLLAALGGWEPLLGYVQSVLVWERPLRSALLFVALNAAFWCLALTPLRMVFLLAFGLIVIVCVDQWKNKIWPELRVARPDELENESWGFVHPGLLSVPELCHHIAGLYVNGTSFLRNLLLFKKENPGKFCILICGLLTFLAVLGSYIPGILLSYLLLLFVLLWPLAMYHRLGERIYRRMEPALQRLDFSVQGYMMSKRRERQMRYRVLSHEPANDGSDSEEELAAFCPKLDDSLVAKELTISDSEHSDAEASYTENGTFNLSRGQTPLTEGSEDLDPEESFARDLPDFPSINPDLTGMDDEDDTSIGFPSTAYRTRTAQDPNLYDEQEAIDSDLALGGLPAAQNFTDNLAGLVTRGMIQLALSGSSQTASAYSVDPQRPVRTYHSNSDSDLDTDAEGDDFELLDQSELNQTDPSTSRSHRSSNI
ncbi:LOW QUALITY PROTEIN: reticulophagy regulator 3 [Microcaecilia unicolor]|uniref:LOW QUALITY PROTEIN: reticulophagy regulator 3 n=1 Tax=Microcaecilia unicolor TaxID=1415580 RepID=A0A6P7ZVD0_9AMPH|nr:LOW QUALITY PROTEIN: reticulophagy regulator 3 [Microcaecilia unicolor]